MMVGGSGALLVGRQEASYAIWDGLRAIDYLAGRPEVDARRLGFETVVIESGCRAIDLAGSLASAWSSMSEAGVQRLADL